MAMMVMNPMMAMNGSDGYDACFGLGQSGAHDSGTYRRHT